MKFKETFNSIKNKNISSHEKRLLRIRNNKIVLHLSLPYLIQYSDLDQKKSYRDKMEYDISYIYSKPYVLFEHKH